MILQAELVAAKFPREISASQCSFQPQALSDFRGEARHMYVKANNISLHKQLEVVDIASEQRVNSTVILKK